MIGDDLTVIVPLWKRTRNLDRLAASVRATVPGAELLLVVSPDDHDTLEAAWEHDARIIVTRWPGGIAGDYARKINLGYRESDAPLIFTGADDIEFTAGWYEAATRLIDRGEHSTQVFGGGAATLTGPFGLMRSHIGVVGTNDDANPRVIAGVHSTHSLVARWYAVQGCSVDQGDMIYHEGYVHEYCDDELVETAMVRDSWAFAADAVVRHHHPIAGRADDDETYQRGRIATRQSQRMFRSRQALWAPYGSVRR